MNSEDIFKGVGIEISLPSPDSFLKIKETLTRIGILHAKKRSSIKLVIFYISKADILFYTLKNCLS